MSIHLSRGRISLLGVATAAVLLLPSAGKTQVIVNPRIRINKSIDFSSAHEVVRQITHPDMTDEQKVVACWKFMLDHYYHWNPPLEVDSSEPVRDFAKAINSYGFGPCFANAPVLTALWEALGYKTRSWTITGHSIPEVFYGGAWHMLDADARGFHRNADGQIAGVLELSRDKALFTKPPGKSDPYYPYGLPTETVKPFDFWGPPSKMMDLYLSRRNNYCYNKRAVMGHPMYVALRPGETLTLSRQNQGKFYVFPKLGEKEQKTGPRQVDGKVTYGNGTLLWRPDLKKISLGELLWLGSQNVQLKDGKLVTADPSKPAVAVFRVRCPWVLVQAKATLDDGFSGNVPGVQLSLDGGHAWTDLQSAGLVGDRAGPHPSTFDLSRHVAGRYEYLLRVTLNKATIASVGFESLFQVSPLSLPKMHPGRNFIKVFRGPDEAVVALTRRGDKAAKDRYVVETKGLNTPKSLTAVKRDEFGYVVYRLAAPDALRGLSIGGNLSLSRGPLPVVQADYSLDGGKTWTQAFRLEKNTNRDNTQFEQDTKIDLPDNTSRQALVKFTIRGDSSHGPGKQYGGVQTVRLYGYYRLPQPPKARMTLELAWQELIGKQWIDKKYSTVVDKFPRDLMPDIGGEQVRLKSITFINAP